MQLSAPTLPIDPAALSAETQTSKSNGSAKEAVAAGGSDFGAMLTARSGRESTEVKNKDLTPKPRAHASSKCGHPVAIANDAGPTELINTTQATRGLSTDSATSASVGPDLAVIPGHVEMPTSAPTDPAALTFSLTGGSGGSDTPPMDDAASAPAASESATVSDTSQSNGGRSGQPVFGSITNRDAQVSARAYGFRFGPISSRANQLSASHIAQGVTHAAAPALLHSQAVAFTQLRAAAVATGNVSQPVTAPQEQQGPVADMFIGASTVETDSMSSAESNTFQAFGVPVTPSEKLPQNGNAQAVLQAAPAEALTDAHTTKLSSADREQTSSVPPDSNLVSVPIDAPVSAISIPSDLALASELAVQVPKEKFAARVPRSSNRPENMTNDAEIDSVATERELVASGLERVGINAAKFENLMTAPASTPTSAPVATGAAGHEMMPLSLDALTRNATEEQPTQIEQTANRAVESVLAVAEQFTPGDQRSVHLQFNVGGEDLAVRVELRGEKVHTTFHAETPELCSALAREWQSVSANHGGERVNRLAEPVFSSSSNGQSFSSDSGSNSQRDAASRNPHAPSQEVIDLKRALRGQSRAVAPVLISVPMVSAAAATPGRLHTFA